MKSLSFVGYPKFSKEMKATIWYTVCNILVKSLSLITVPIFTRILSETDYGIVSVYNGWHDIFFIFGTLNLFYAVYNNAMLRYRNDIAGYTSSMIILIDIIAIVFFASYCIWPWLWRNVFQLSPTLLMIIFIELFTVPAYNFWMSEQRFFFRYKMVVVVTLLIAISSPILSFILVGIAEDLATAKIVGTAFPSILIGAMFSLYFLYKGKKYIEIRYWMYALKFNIPLIPHYLSGTVLNQCDRIMIARSVSNAKAGIYSVAYNASFTITIVTTAINNSLVPWIYNKMREKEYEMIEKRTAMILSFFAIVLLFFMLIIPEFVMILAPPSYQEAIGILPILVMSVFFQFLYGFFGTVEFYYERSIYVMLASVIAAVLNILTNLWMIPVFGYLAAAYTTLFCFVMMSCTHYIFLRIVLKKEKVDATIFDIKRIIFIAGIFVGIGFLELSLYRFIIIRYMIAGVICMVLISRYKWVLHDK